MTYTAPPIQTERSAADFPVLFRQAAGSGPPARDSDFAAFMRNFAAPDAPNLPPPENPASPSGIHPDRMARPPEDRAGGQFSGPEPFRDAERPGIAAGTAPPEETVRPLARAAEEKKEEPQKARSPGKDTGPAIMEDAEKSGPARMAKAPGGRKEAAGTAEAETASSLAEAARAVMALAAAVPGQVLSPRHGQAEDTAWPEEFSLAGGDIIPLEPETLPGGAGALAALLASWRETGEAGTGQETAAPGGEAALQDEPDPAGIAKSAGPAAGMAAKPPKVETAPQNGAAPLRSLEEGAGNDALLSLEEEGEVRETGEGRDRRRVTLELRDLRTEEPGETAGAAAGRENAGGQDGGEGDQSRGEARFVLDLQGRAQSQAGDGAIKEGRGAFQELLTRELRQHLSGDIVRQASILLRDGGEGVIRLSLRPESLGNVKIRLDLSENKITGMIVVDSEEALRAFEQEIASLEQAFRDSGYGEASLQMSVSDGGGGSFQKNGEKAPWFSGRLARSSYDGSASWEDDAAPRPDGFRAENAVNMLV